MVHCFTLTLLLFTSTATYAWVLQTNVDHITPHKTNNVQLLCTQGDNMESDQSVKTLNGIRIIKIDSFGNKNTFAEMHILSPEAWSRDNEADVDASMNQTNRAFLKVTWPVANDETEGAYRCEISGYNALDNHVTINVRPSVKISRKTLNEDDVINLIQKMTQSHIRKQKELEREILSLKRFINENLHYTRQHIKNIDDEMKAKLSSLQNTIESTSCNKSELKDQVSELKNFTLNNILIAKNQHQREREKLSDLLKNTSSNCERQFSETVQNLSNFKEQFTSSVDSLNKEDRNISSHLRSTANTLTRQIHSVDTKYGRVTQNLNSDFKRKITELEQKCTVTTPSPTSVRPTQRPIVSDWPEGRYALARPETGCANLDELETMGRSLFISTPYDSIGFQKVEKGVNKAKEFKLTIGSDSKKTSLKYCLKDTSIPSLSSPPWPKGTYCIGLIGGRCPHGFTYGYLNYHFQKDGKFVGEYKMVQCCRADQKADVPIKLPKALPFYLYRYKGTCQQVEGMTVKGHVLQIKMSSGSGRVNFTSKHADISKQKTTVYMCHYQPSWCPR